MRGEVIGGLTAKLRCVPIGKVNAWRLQHPCQIARFTPRSKMPYGRGGAGNIQALEQENARVSADLEANQQAAESDRKGRLPAQHPEREEQQYAHTGRGGMGNFFSPKELSRTGNFSDAHRSHILGDGTQPPAESAEQMQDAPPSYNAALSNAAPTRTVGRGGAGNYSFGVSESEEKAARKRIEDEKMREKLKEEIEAGVKDQLAMPPKAKLPGGEPL